jgi:hypothetical protein
MVDRVRPLKLESTATGGSQDDLLPTAVNPTQDYIVSKGLALEDDDNTRIEKDVDGDIVAISATAGTVKLRSPIPLIIALG